MDGQLMVRSRNEAGIGSGDSRDYRSRSRFLCSCFLLSMAVLMWAGNAFAHHGGAEWDAKATTTVQGTITDFRFINPHVQIFFDSKDEKGNLVHWSCEAADPAMLVRDGWTRLTLKPGDLVTFVGHPAKSGAKMIELQKLTLSDGRELSASGNGSGR
jgi:hypothetical protein